MVTHPDKTIEIQSKHLRDQLCNQYRITQHAYKREVYSDLIMVAFDLNIKVPESVINEHISPSLDKKKKNILQTKSLIGWQWYRVPENQKDGVIKIVFYNNNNNNGNQPKINHNNNNNNNEETYFNLFDKTLSLPYDVLYYVLIGNIHGLNIHGGDWTIRSKFL